MAFADRGFDMAGAFGGQRGGGQGEASFMGNFLGGEGVLPCGTLPPPRPKTTKFIMSASC
ncbi:hypothetical protein ACFSUK_13250 [Sphingobium scionense]